jgi:hypothetical protein
MPPRPRTSSSARRCLDPPPTRKRTSQVGAVAARYSRLRTKSGRQREGTSGVCHRAEHKCWRRASRGTALPPAVEPGVARDSECTLGRWCLLAEVVSNPASQARANHPCGGVSPSRLEVFAPFAQPETAICSSCPAESRFFSVKSFSHKVRGLNSDACIRPTVLKSAGSTA